jgi:hypothetical protein
MTRRSWKKMHYEIRRESKMFHHCYHYIRIVNNINNKK